jgi:hypothetical protein
MKDTYTSMARLHGYLSDMHDRMQNAFLRMSEMCTAEETAKAHAEMVEWQAKQMVRDAQLERDASERRAALAEQRLAGVLEAMEKMGAGPLTTAGG